MTILRLSSQCQKEKKRIKIKKRVIEVTDQRTQEAVKDQELIHERQRKKNSDEGYQRTQK